MFSAAMEDNLQRMRQVVAREGDDIRVVDLGCWDGETALHYVPPRARVVGIESNADAAMRAGNRPGWKVMIADLNLRLPLGDSCCDVVTSNQVFEHVNDTDHFINEAIRIAKPGGLVVISTENMASWHNIGSLIMGWQAFSLTNVSELQNGLGNPLANLRSSEPFRDAGWQHHRVFSYKGLLELAVASGLEGAHILGSGYYPLPNVFAHLDAHHAAFITVVGRKPGVGQPTV